MKTVNILKIRSKFILTLLFSLISNFIFSVLPSITLAGQIKLAWDPNPQPEVAGYKVYYGTTSHKYTDVLDVQNQTTIDITGLTEGSTYYFTVTDYTADYSVESPASNEVSGIIAVSSPVPPPPPAPTPSPIPGGQTLLSNQLPQLLHDSDGSGASFEYELGMRFMSTTPGIIKAIRFYKDSSESGTHTGKIYSASGKLLASVAFTSETSSGWQQQLLSTPLSISANTEYTVTVNTGNTFYVDTISGMSTKITNGSLFSIVGNNGVYGAVGSMPTNSYMDSNYFRDIVFVAGSTTPTPTPPPPPPPISIPEPPPKPIADIQKPVVSITSPKTGTAVVRNKSYIIKAAATDNKGVKKVLFYVNNVLKCTILKAPYTCTTIAPNKVRQKLNIQVKAFDAANNIGVSKIVTLTTK